MEWLNRPTVVTTDPMPVFDEEAHTYAITLADGTKAYLISVTQILQKQGISPSYKFVKKDVLEAAASRGTTLHKEIEEYNNDGTIGFSPEMQSYADFVESNGITPVMAECLVWTDFYAGKFDNLWLTKDGRLILTDNKFTSSLHVESVSWQLSLYAYAFYKVYHVRIDGIMACWFKDGVMHPTELMMKSDEEIEAMLACQREGKKYTAPYPLDVDVIAEAEYWKQKADEYRKLEEDAKSHLGDLQETIIAGMREHNTTKFDTGFATFTLSVRNGAGKIDTDKLAQEHPEIDMNSYSVAGKTTTSLIIKLKENK